MPNHPTFQLDRSAPGSLVEKLKGEIRRRVSAGIIRPGDRLPPTRRLADELGVNRGTVTAAYEELRAEGMLSGQVGRGTFISVGLDVDSLEREAPAPGPFRWAAHLAGFQPPREEEALRSISPDDLDTVSFASNIPDAALFPTEEFRRALNRALEESGSALLSYGDPAGQPRFREFVRGYLAEQHRVVVRDEEMLVVNGSQQAMDLLARAFLRPGDTVLVEEPSYHGALGLLRGYGARLVGVPVDEDGIRVEDMEPVLARERPKLVYVMPTFQNPTGFCLTDARRDALVRLTARYEVPVIEDDFDGELYFDRPPPAPLKSRPASDGVIYIGTPSKMLFPGLRLGWIAAAEPVARRLARIRQIADLSGSPLLQEALARFAETGDLDRHMPRVREAYGRRLERLIAALGRHMPDGVSWTRPRGGLSLLVTLPEGLDSGRLLTDAARAGVLYSPGRMFFISDGARYLRLSFGNVATERVEEGVKRLAGVLRGALDRKIASSPRARGVSLPPV